jgi:hypothetical protein
LRSRVLIYVAQAAGKLRDPAEGRTVLDNVLAAAESGYGQAERAAVFLALAETAAKLGDPAQARALLGTAAQETQGISADLTKARALVALAETTSQLGDTAQSQTALKAVEAMRQRFGAKIVTDPDLTRAVTVAASLQEWKWALSMADQFSTDNAKLDALSRVYAVWRN